MFVIDRFAQERARPRSARALEGFATLGQHSPEAFFAKRPLQRVAALNRTVGRQFARGANSRDRGGIARKRGRRKVGTERVGNVGQQIRAGIEPHQFWFEVEQNRYRLLGMLDANAYGALTRARRIRREREIDLANEGRVGIVDRLLLFEGNRRRAPLRIVRGRNRELRMTSAKDPLVEESAHVAAGGVFDGPDEVYRLDAAFGIVANVSPYRPPKARIAQFAAKHVQHRRALLVEMAIEELDRIAKPVIHDGTAVAIRVFLEIPLQTREDVVEILVGAEIRFAVDGFKKRGEALVEPCVGPIAAGEQVAEPLMGEIVRNQRVAGKIDVRAIRSEA